MENERAKDHWTGRGLSEGDFDRGLRTQMTRMPFIRAIRAIRGLVLEPSGQAGRQGVSAGGQNQPAMGESKPATLR